MINFFDSVTWSNHNTQYNLPIAVATLGEKESERERERESEKEKNIKEKVFKSE